MVPSSCPSGDLSDVDAAEDQVAVSTDLVGQDGEVVGIRVSVPEKWFGAADRKFPVTIDPWAWLALYYAADTYAQVGQSAPYGSNDWFKVGVSSTGYEALGYLRFWGLPQDAQGAHVAIRQSELCMRVLPGQEANPKPITAVGVAAFDYATLMYQSGAPNNGLPLVDGRVPATNGNMPGQATTPGWAASPSCGGYGWTSVDVSNATGVRQREGMDWVAIGLSGNNQSGAGTAKDFISVEGASPGHAYAGTGGAPVLMLNWKWSAYQTTLVSPADGEQVATMTPTLQAMLPNPLEPAAGGGGANYPGPVQIMFQVGTSPDLNSGGQVWSSGWLSAPATGQAKSSTMPANILENGGTYYWSAIVFDGEIWSVASNARKFTVNLQLGGSGPSPYDSLGPATVNLATGNLFVKTQTQSFPAVGGTVGATFSYNSLAPSDQGLKGEYFGQNNYTNLVAERRTPSLWFNWGTGPPFENGPISGWSARWSGYVQASGTGGASNYTIWTSHVGATNIYVDGGSSAIYSQYNSGYFGWFKPSWPVSWTPGSWHKITVDFVNLNTASGLDVRLIKGTADPNVSTTSSQPLGGSLLKKSDSPLPDQWALSADIDGSLPYVRLANSNNTVSLVQADGGLDRFTWTGTVYRPEGSASGDLFYGCATPTQCGWTWSGNGTSIYFTPRGEVGTSSTVADEFHAASLVYTWNTPPGLSVTRLRSITDPVSGKQAIFSYRGQSSGEVCATPSETPIGMLCDISFTASGPDAGHMSLSYTANRLTGFRRSREVTGGVGWEDVTFKYNNGLISEIRDPLANEKQLANQIPNDSRINTIISYFTSGPESGRVQSVKTPEPAPTLVSTPDETVRQLHTYAYTGAPLTTTTVQGRTQATTGTGVTIRTVNYDSATTRLLTDQDATGHVTWRVWNDAMNAVEKTIDPAGLATTTIFDTNRRLPIETWGPATNTWFTAQNGLAPAAANVSQVPHTTVAYDTAENGTPWQGLVARWYDTYNPGAVPTKTRMFSSTFGPAELGASWGAGSPEPAIGADTFSGVLSGDIWLQAATTNTPGGRWWFRVEADDQASLFIDDQIVTSGVAGQAGEASIGRDLITTDWHKVRVVTKENAGTASFRVLYRIGSTGSWVPIVTSQLRPRLDLATRATGADGKISTTRYDEAGDGIEKVLGIATATTADYGGLNSVTSSRFEDVGNANGFIRPDHKYLPSGAASETTESFYAPGATAAYPTGAQTYAGCPTLGSAPNQAGFVKKHLDADPGSGAVSIETIYNQQGSSAFTKESGDTQWSCSAVDARLRPAKSITRGKQIQYAYAPGEVTTSYTNPEGGADLTTIARVDLLGRRTFYQDERGSQTRSVFDVAGRPIQTWRKLPGGSDTMVWASFGYDNDNRRVCQNFCVNGRDGH